MTQTLRPDSTVSQIQWTSGGYAQIDESVADDGDFARSQAGNSILATLEVSLSNPAAAPGAGTTTIRYRVAKLTNAGALSSSGADAECTVFLKQGASTLDTDTTRVLNGAWTTYSFEPDVSGVTDWDNLRLNFLVTTSDAGAARCGAISWAELEAPASSSYSMSAGSGSFTFTGKSVAFTKGRLITASAGTFVLTGAAANLFKSSAVVLTAQVGDFAFTGSSVSLFVGYLIPASAGTFTLDGAAAGLSKGRAIAADSGSFALAGSDAELTADFKEFAFAGLIPARASYRRMRFASSGRRTSFASRNF